jgi:two-component system sensor histidine kinase DesK
MERQNESKIAPMKTVYANFTRNYGRLEAQLTRMHGAPPVVAASGISLRLWRLYAQAWLVCLLFPILTLIQQPRSPPQLLAPLAGMAIFVIIYTRIMWSHPLHSAVPEQRPRRTSALLLAGLVALVLALSWGYGGAFLWLLVGVSAIAGVLLPARSAFLTVMLLTLLALGASVGVAGGVGATDWLHVVPLVLLVRGLGLDMAGLARLASALREVHMARGELARVAVIEERLRMARDLHDLLGQSLSMITLKSELAARLIGLDPLQAAQEMRDVEQAARRTLREVRAAVAGYRQPTVSGELEGARQLFEAAGIEWAIEQQGERLPSAVDAVLAWAVREGVTNVIRHSRALSCQIRITNERGTVTMLVINDRPCAPKSNGAPAHQGSGLAGLAERVAAYGGRVAADPLRVDGAPAFRLCVQLPAASATAAEQESLP